MSEIIREEHKENFTIMSNHHFKDRSLSLKAMGLLSLMLSLPPGWKYSVKGMAALCKDGIDSVRSTMLELETAGYLDRERTRLSDGRYSENNYTIREIPCYEKKMGMISQFSYSGNTASGITASGHPYNEPSTVGLSDTIKY